MPASNARQLDLSLLSAGNWRQFFLPEAQVLGRLKIEVLDVD
jgi:hypothetical protein